MKKDRQVDELMLDGSSLAEVSQGVCMCVHATRAPWQTLNATPAGTVPAKLLPQLSGGMECRLMHGLQQR